jgi:hypothetical protein
MTVTLRTALHVVATVTLYARCYRTYYVPLKVATYTALSRLDGTLLIEPADPSHSPGDTDNIFA